MGIKIVRSSEYQNILGENFCLKAEVQEAKTYIKSLLTNHLPAQRLATIQNLKELMEAFKTNNIRTQALERDQSWVSGGLDIVQGVINDSEASGNLDMLGQQILKGLSTYLKLPLAAMYMVERSDAETNLRVLSTYGINISSELLHTSEQGLLGECYKSKQFMVLDSVPHQYYFIQSGLGHIQPQALLLAPILVRDEVLGIFELASYKPFQEKEIELVRKVCFSINTFMATIKYNIENQKMLDAYKEQAQILKRQEQDLLKKMKELEIVQAEMTQKKLEVELSEARVRAIFDSTIDALVTFSSNGIILMCNSAVKNIFGYRPDEIINEKIQTLIPDLFGDKLNQLSSFESSDLYAVNHQGDKFPVELKVKAGEFKGESILVATIRDITHKKAAEEEIVEMEAKMRIIFEESLDPILMLNKNRKIQMLNPAGELYFGYNALELMGKSLSSIFHDGVNDFDSLPLNSPIEVVSLKKDGTRLNTLIKLKEVLVNSNRTFILVVKDITDSYVCQNLQQKESQNETEIEGYKKKLEEAAIKSNLNSKELDYYYQIQRYLDSVKTTQNGNLKILIVEDEPIFAMRLEELILLEGFCQVVVCFSGEEAIKATQDYHPDIVFMDYKLSGKLNGICTVQLLRERFDFSVIFITAHSKSIVPELKLSISKSFFMDKPIRGEKVIELLKLAAVN